MILNLKVILIICLLLTINLSHATSVTCYIKDTKIYHVNIDDVQFDSNYIVLFVYKENMAYYIKGTCYL